MNLCKLAMLAAFIVLIPQIHADEVVPFHGKLDSNGIADLRPAVLAKILRASTGASDITMDANGHYYDFDPRFLYNGIGKLYGTFEIGRCPGVSIEASENYISQATRRGDIPAAAVFTRDLLRRTRCEAAHSGECKFLYKSLSEDRLKVWILPKSCVGTGVKDKNLQEAAVEIYRVDGNNAAISDVTVELEHQP